MSGLQPELFKADAELRNAFLSGERGTRRVIVVLEAQPMADVAPGIWDRHMPELERRSAELRAEREPRSRKELAAELKVRRDAIRDEILRTTLPELVESQNAAITALRLAGAQRVAPLTRTLNTLVADISIESLDRVTALNEIARLVIDRYQEPYLEVSVPSTRISQYAFHQVDGGSSVVAIVDTGIDFSHPAITDPQHQSHVNLTSGQNDACFDDNVSPDDMHGHGTHIAGVVRSSGSLNWPNHIGMAPAARLINLKSGWKWKQITNCLQQHPFSAALFSSDAMANIDWAVHDASPKADVISYSWGGRTNSQDYEYAGMPQYLDVLSSWLHVFVAVAAGNEGKGSDCPKVITGDDEPKPCGSVDDVASAYNLVAVGAFDDRGTTHLGDDVLYEKSSRGPTKDGRIKPDVVAPGVNIYSASNNWEGGGTANDFVPKQGTSMAAPHVAAQRLSPSTPGCSRPCSGRQHC